MVSEAGLHGLDWRLKLATAKDDSAVADAILDVVARVDAELLIIGARRRSPIRKFLLGSSAQSMILKADVPVFVVKS